MAYWLNNLYDIVKTMNWIPGVVAILAMVYIFIVWCVVMFAIRNIHISMAVGKASETECTTNEVFENQTERFKAYSSFNENRSKLINLLTALNTLYMIIIMFMTLYVLLITTSYLNNNVIEKVFVYQKSMMTTMRWTMIVIAMVILAGISYMTSNMFNINQDTTKYGVVIDTKPTDASFIILSVWLVISASIICYTMPNSINGFLIILSFLLIGMIYFLFSLIREFNNWGSLYQDKTMTLNDSIRSAIKNDVHLAHSLENTIIASDGLTIKPNLDTDYKDNIFQYITHYPINDTNALTKNTNYSNLGTELYHVRATSKSMDSLKTSLFNIMMFTILLLIVIAYVCFHYFYIINRVFTIQIIIVIFILMAITVLYAWFSGESLGLYMDLNDKN